MSLAIACQLIKDLFGVLLRRFDWRAGMGQGGEFKPVPSIGQVAVPEGSGRPQGLAALQVPVVAR